MRHASGVPIKSVVLLRAMTDPVVVSRMASDYATGTTYKLYDSASGGGMRTAARAYVGGNNHHIEIRTARNANGKESWSGEVVSSFEAAQRNLAKLRALKASGLPRARSIRNRTQTERLVVVPELRD